MEIINEERMSYYNYELNEEQRFHKLIFKPIYEELTSVKTNVSYKEIHFQTDEEKKLQYSGVDVIFSAPLKNGEMVNFYIDEKCPNSRINSKRPLSTFMLELSYICQSGERIDGWFTLPNMLTTHYVMFFPDTFNGDVVEGDVIWVNKDRITNVICDILTTAFGKKCTLNDIRTINHKIADGKWTVDEINKYLTDTNIRFFFNDYLQHDISIIVNKDIYMKNKTYSKRVSFINK